MSRMGWGALAALFISIAAPSRATASSGTVYTAPFSGTQVGTSGWQRVVTFDLGQSSYRSFLVTANIQGLGSGVTSTQLICSLSWIRNGTPSWGSTRYASIPTQQYVTGQVTLPITLAVMTDPGVPNALAIDCVANGAGVYVYGDVFAHEVDLIDGLVEQ